MRPCECGCGEEIDGFSRNRRNPKRFKHGHNRRGLRSNWNGGIRHVSSGYIEILKPDHPFCNNSGYVREHRLVIEEKLGRYLTLDEDVHHINGIKNDNRIENLLLVTHGEHSRITQTKRWSVIKYSNDVL